jgi:hypothetical protein
MPIVFDDLFDLFRTAFDDVQVRRYRFLYTNRDRAFDKVIAPDRSGMSFQSKRLRNCRFAKSKAAGRRA